MVRNQFGQPILTLTPEAISSATIAKAVAPRHLCHPLSPDITGHFFMVEKLGGHDVVRFGRLVAHYDFYLAKSYRP